jgi:Mrp family chromosome partitioning ATPase
VATISRTHAAEMVKELRSENDYVVVDAGNLAKNGLGLLLLGSADLTIVAFRAGRAQQLDDRLMLDSLERAEAKVFGVIMTDQPTIEHFAHRDDPAVSAIEEPRVDEPRVVEPLRVPVLKKVELALSRLVGLS